MSSPPTPEPPSGDASSPSVESIIAAQLEADARTCIGQGLLINTLDYHLCLRGLAAQRRAAAHDALRAQQRKRREPAGWCWSEAADVYVRCRDI
jgi:hypothetical protein